MAQEPQAESEIERLIARIAANRDTVAADALRVRQTLRRRLDVEAMLRQSLRRHPAAWFGSSVVIGALLSGWVFRRRAAPPVAACKTWPKWLLGALAATAKPLIRDWIVRQTRKRFQPLQDL